MDLEAININKNNRLMADYHQHDSNIINYFHYHPFKGQKTRLEDISQRKFKRDELVDLLRTMNKEWQAPQETMAQIERLTEEDSVVVIGGQQAGLLTGPMYSLNKAISIIKYAKEQERLLNVPVIPVFWIAGEDHDFDEINHTYMLKDSKLTKHALKQYEPIKKSVSDLSLDKDEVEHWLQNFLNELKETQYTKKWFDKTLQALSGSKTFVDFFAQLIFQLFDREGLVLFNSHDKRVRALEQPFLLELLQNHQQITKQVVTTQKAMQNNGYFSNLDVKTEDVNLFYHGSYGERILLKYESGYFMGKNNEVQFTYEEIKKLMTESPESFSNNVLTRPMMQEYLFPTLAFIAGDGEINYWATLKAAFETMGLKMPLVVPRLSFTYISRGIAKLASKKQIAMHDIVQNGIFQYRQNWLYAQQPIAIDPLFIETKQNIKSLYAPLESMVGEINPDLTREAKKNLTYIFHQIDYFKNRVHKELHHQYATELAQFDLLEDILHPNQSLQERVFNPYSIINAHGFDFIKKLIADQRIEFGKKHYLVYLSN